MFIFLDESGTLTESDSKYFVVGSYSVGDPHKITKEFRKWQKVKFPKKLRRQFAFKNITAFRQTRYSNFLHIFEKK